MNELGLTVTTPGSSKENCPVLRPFSGNEARVVPEITWPTVADSVCRTGDSLVTSTVSSVPPSSSLKSSRTICLASTWIGFVVAVLKRERSALTMYVPTGTDVMV